MLVFKERGKTRVPGEKPLGAKERANNKTQPTYGTDTGIEAQAILVGSDCSLHCATIAPSLTYHQGHPTTVSSYIH